MDPVWVRVGPDWVAGTLEAGVPRALPDAEPHPGADTLPRNPDHNPRALRDLILLPHLNEASILHALQQRFAAGKIYTFTGPVLLAVNPFKALPLYSADVLLAARGQGLSGAPHAYAVADAAFSAMREGANQSLLVSGESGAGKTETVKIVMQFLATVGAAEGAPVVQYGAQQGTELVESSGSVQQRVLQSTPILEAFGNARTVRNDNSSRFGKYIRLEFDARGRMAGAAVQTYLLERVRLVAQAPDERTFHVFYELLAGASDAEREEWALGAAEDYRYTWGGRCAHRKDRVDDEGQFVKTRAAMREAGFSAADAAHAFRLVAAVLWLGDAEFAPSVRAEEEGSVMHGAAAGHAARLLEVPEARLTAALTTREIRVGAERFTKPLPPPQAAGARDALAKDLYARLFEHVVAKINAGLGSLGAAADGFIGVLDIFGFEVFEQNSFEQLCINYANELLQQLFNEFVFKREQDEYEREGIEWSMVDFPDNRDNIDVIEGAVLAALGDVCAVGGSDDAFARRLYETGQVRADKRQRAAGVFCVRHYAGEVAYTAAGFTAKNRDDLFAEAHAAMRESRYAHLFPGATPAAGGRRGSVGAAASTLASKFAGQLAALLDAIRATEPHFVRCLKPNDANVPDAFARPRVLDQLRYSGVTESVRIARAGFPVRYPFAEFEARYRCCLGLTVESAAALVQVGRTKVFLRQAAYDELEGRRNAARRAAAVRLQARARAAALSRRFAAMRAAAVRIAAAARGRAARRLAAALRRARAAVRLQTRARGWVARRRFARHKAAALAAQCAWRCARARRRAQSRRRRRAAAVTLQCAARARAAGAHARRLRREARQVGSLQRERAKLQERVQALVASLEAKDAEIACAEAAADQKAELEALVQTKRAAEEAWARERSEAEAHRIRSTLKMRARLDEAVAEAAALRAALAATGAEHQRSQAELARVRRRASVAASASSSAAADLAAAAHRASAAEAEVVKLRLAADGARAAAQRAGAEAKRARADAQRSGDDAERARADARRAAEDAAAARRAAAAVESRAAAAEAEAARLATEVEQLRQLLEGVSRERDLLRSSLSFDDGGGGGGASAAEVRSLEDEVRDLKEQLRERDERLEDVQEHLTMLREQNRLMAGMASRRG